MDMDTGSTAPLQDHELGEPQAKRVKLSSDEGEASTSQLDQAGPAMGVAGLDVAGQQDTIRGSGLGEHSAMQNRSSPAEQHKRSKTPLSWSTTNCIAVGSTSKISIIPLHAPRLVCHLSVHEKPHALAFSPHGDALLALFWKSRNVCLWSRTGASLNQWTLRQQWHDLDGRVVAFQWLAAGRRHVPVINGAGGEAAVATRRPAARGPQFGGDDAGQLLVCIVTDRGQVSIAQGSSRSKSSFQMSQRKIDVPAGQRIQHASIGLVAGEPTMLLAYTLRPSKRSSPMMTAKESDAFELLFDDEEVASTSEDRSVAQKDGTDTIELVELTVQIAPSDCRPLFIWRPLEPIFTGSFEDPGAPFVKDVVQLLWADIEPASAEEGSVMKLLGVFDSSAQDTLVQSWLIRREKGTKLSAAFAKLDSAKKAEQSTQDEEWTPQGVHKEQIGNRKLRNLTTHPTHPSLVFGCSTASVGSQGDTQGESTLAVLDTSTLKSQAKEGPIRFDLNSALLLSPHGTLLAFLKHGKLVLTRTNVDGIDAHAIFEAAVKDISDLQDLDSATYTESLDKLSHRIAPQGSRRLMQAIKLAELDCQRQQGLKKRHMSSARMLLELVQVLRVVDDSQIMVDNGMSSQVSFRAERIWTLLSFLEWTTALCEEMARQAHLLTSTADVSTPPSSDMYGQDNEADISSALLGYLAFDTPRRLLAILIAKLISFVNWMERVLEDDGATQKLLRAFLENNPDGAENHQSLDEIVQKLLLCRTKIRETLSGAAIDLGQFGRAIKHMELSRVNSKEPAIVASTGEATTDAHARDTSQEQQWWRGPLVDRDKRIAAARALLENGKVVRDMLALFCPSSQLQMAPLGCPATTTSQDIPSNVLTQRDIFTKAFLPLPLGQEAIDGGTTAAHSTRCLACGAITKIAALPHGVRCVCGSSAWWTSSRS